MYYFSDPAINASGAVGHGWSHMNSAILYGGGDGDVSVCVCVCARSRTCARARVCVLAHACARVRGHACVREVFAIYGNNI